jgi:hypothetical protein
VPDLDYADLWEWEPFDPLGLAHVLAGIEAPWWLAGGWALELALDLPSRRHKDVDVALLRRDQMALQRHLGAWDLRYARPDHRLERWRPREELEPPVHGIWARRRPDEPWLCEFLLNEADGETWRFRRDLDVTLPLARLGRIASDGIPVLAPEVVLLYMATEPTAAEAAYFASALARLDSAARAWLRHALARADPNHVWLGRL